MGVLFLQFAQPRRWWPQSNLSCRLRRQSGSLRWGSRLCDVSGPRRARGGGSWLAMRAAALRREVAHGRSALRSAYPTGGSPSLRPGSSTSRLPTPGCATGPSFDLTMWGPASASESPFRPPRLKLANGRGSTDLRTTWKQFLTMKAQRATGNSWSERPCLRRKTIHGSLVAASAI